MAYQGQPSNPLKTPARAAATFLSEKRNRTSLPLSPSEPGGLNNNITTSIMDRTQLLCLPRPSLPFAPGTPVLSPFKYPEAQLEISLHRQHLLPALWRAHSGGQRRKRAGRKKAQRAKTGSPAGGLRLPDRSVVGATWVRVGHLGFLECQSWVETRADLGS